MIERPSSSSLISSNALSLNINSLLKKFAASFLIFNKINLSFLKLPYALPILSFLKLPFFTYSFAFIFSFDFNVQLPEVSEFQKNVWELCLKIPYGETKSYEDIAMDVNESDNYKKSNYSRAVGMALSKNPVLLVIPCHRVIGKDGKLRGFSAGVDFKDFLLKHEMQNLWSLK